MSALEALRAKEAAKRKNVVTSGMVQANTNNTEGISVVTAQGDNPSNDAFRQNSPHDPVTVSSTGPHFFASGSSAAKPPLPPYSSQGGNGGWTAAPGAGQTLQPSSRNSSRPASRDSSHNVGDSESEGTGAVIGVFSPSSVIGTSSGNFGSGSSQAASTLAAMEERGISATFDGSKEEVIREIDWSDRAKAIHQFVPRRAKILCTVKREKKGFGKNPVYSVYLSETNFFIMSAKKRTKNKSSNYVISLDEKDLDRESDAFVGKVRSNFIGTEFVVYDNGVNPKKANADQVWRQEMCAVFYEKNILGSKGPRKMQVLIPRILSSGQPRIFRPETERETIAGHFKADLMDDIIPLKNKSPIWNELSRAYVLNFDGRVTEASVKNFQLVVDGNSTDESDVLLQFGKTGKDTFTMDVKWPLSIFQAFAIVLTSFDNKLACE